MADPLSITASAVGIIVPALHGTRLLLEDLQQLKDAPKTVKRLVEDVDTALKLLQSVEEREWGLLGAGIAEQSETTINSCNCQFRGIQSPLSVPGRYFWWGDAAAISVVSTIFRACQRASLDFARKPPLTTALNVWITTCAAML